MTIAASDFQANFPIFKGPSYTTAGITFWITLGYMLMDPGRWGNILDYGCQLFVAHNLALEAMGTAGAAQGIPGAIMGPVSSASVDKVAYSRDVQGAMLPDAGHWNLSTYGLRYKQLVKMMGAGPVQVGAPCGPGGSMAGNGDGFFGWPGVIYPPPY